MQGRYAKAEAQRGLLRPAGRSVPSSTTRGLEAKMRAAREATAQATNDMINRAAQMASDLSDPSRSIRGSQAGRFVVHSALPPVGQKPVAPEVVQPRVSVPEHSLSGLDDAAYLEVMEQDILAAQAQILSALAIRGAPDIRSREAAVPGAPSHATRSFTERDLADRRNLGATAAKLQLHEILNEKLRQLERIALVEHATVEGVHGPQLSRLPSLMALLKLAGGTAGRGGSAPEAAAAPASSAAEAARRRRRRGGGRGTGGGGNSTRDCGRGGGGRPEREGSLARGVQLRAAWRRRAREQLTRPRVGGGGEDARVRIESARDEGRGDGTACDAQIA